MKLNYKKTKLKIEGKIQLLGLRGKIICAIGFIILFFMAISIYLITQFISYGNLSKKHFDQIYFNTISINSLDKIYIEFENSYSASIRSDSHNEYKENEALALEFLRDFNAEIRSLKNDQTNITLKNSIEQLSLNTNKLLELIYTISNDFKEEKIEQTAGKWEENETRNLIKDNLIEISDLIQSDGKEKQFQIKHNLDLVIKICIFAIIIVSILSIIFAVFISKSISRPFILTFKNLNEVAEKLENITDKTSKISRDVANAKLVKINSIQSVKSQMDNNLSILNDATESTKRSNILVGQGKDTIQKGKMVILDMSQAMDRIKKSNEKLRSFAGIMNQINKKGEKINQIVSESRLLSFNAEIEAAHAGNFGKGFSVVAEEMGKLANYSGEISKEISSVIKSSVQELDEIIKQTKETIELGNTKSTDCQKSFTDIETSLIGIFSQIDNIRSFSSKQANGLNSVGQEMKKLEEIINVDGQYSLNLEQNSLEIKNQIQNINQSIDGLKNILKIK